VNSVIIQAHNLLKNAGFDYAVCGGYGLDMFAGRELRPHGDFDIVAYNEDKQRIVNFFIDNDWIVFGRFMEEGKRVTQFLFYKIEDITDSYWNDCKNMWVVKSECLSNVLEKINRLQEEVYTYKPRKWLVQNEIEFIEIEFDARKDNNFILQEDPIITRSMDKSILYRDGIPYLAPEIILYYKTDRFSNENPAVKQKTTTDFNAIMPLLSDDSRNWLLDAVTTAYPNGYEWLDGLM
jgi:hypothetical protein